MQRVSECHLTLFVMVAVGFTVGCDVNNLRPGPRIRKRRVKAACEVFSLFQQALKRDRLRNRAVVKEHRYPFARRQPHAIRHGRIDTAAACITPGAASQFARAFRLIRRQYGEPDVEAGKYVEHFKINRSLGQPHSFGPASKPKFKIANPPKDLSVFVAGV